jgi:Protein of unknown function (DUF992)
MYKILTAAFLSLLAFTPAAEANTGIKIGVLSCGIGGGIGYIIGSSKPIDCVFQATSGARPEHYSGTIRKLGLDIGVTSQSVVVWAVFAPGKTKRGELKGYYAGASAEATVIAGLGANVLIGGFHNDVNLQPLSVQAQTGLNVAAGVTGLRLRYAGH